MLVLTRKVGDSILIGSDIKIQVVKVKGCQVRLGIEAPKETKVFREEVLAKKPPQAPQERSASASASSPPSSSIVRPIQDSVQSHPDSPSPHDSMVR